MSVEIITSFRNAGVKFARSLRSRRTREETGLTLIEGYRAVSRALDAEIAFRECYFAPSLFLGDNENALLEAVSAAGGRLLETTGDILSKMSYRDRPEGLVAVVETRKHSLEALPVVEKGLYLVAESIEKPGNVGAILRSLDGAGADGLILCGPRTDLYNPNVVTASTGAVFSFPIAEASNEEALAWLRARGIPIAAATPEADMDYNCFDSSKGAALVVGAEQYGLTDFWKENADVKIGIPMAGRVVDSLNVATAAAVLVFAATRRRTGN